MDYPFRTKPLLFSINERRQVPLSLTNILHLYSCKPGLISYYSIIFSYDMIFHVFCKVNMVFTTGLRPVSFLVLRAGN